MSVAPLFSKDYYTKSGLFDKQELAPVATDLLAVHTYHAVVNNETIATVPFSLLDNMKRFFTFPQDRNLIAVYQRLKILERQLWNPINLQLLRNPINLQLQAFKGEMKNKGIYGATQSTNNLRSNIEALSSLFKKSNEKSPLALTMLKVVNFVRKCLRLEPITFFTFAPINLPLLEQRMIQPALEFTTQPLPEPKFDLHIQNDYNNSHISGLSYSNLRKLEYGALPPEKHDTLHFSIDEKKFGLKFDHEKQEFALCYYRSQDINNPTMLELLNSNDPYSIHREPSLDVVEEKPDGTRSTLNLKYTFTASNKKKAWYNPFAVEGRKQDLRPGRITLITGNKYSIRLSQGYLSLGFSPRSETPS